MTERCLCGAAVRNVWADAYGDLPPEERPAPIWRHLPGSDTRCEDVSRIADILPDAETMRASAGQMATLNDRTRRAAGEAETMQSQLSELADEVMDLVSALRQPEVIRRGVLMEVWHALIEAGDLGAALTVRALMVDGKGGEL